VKWTKNTLIKSDRRKNLITGTSPKAFTAKKPRRYLKQCDEEKKHIGIFLELLIQELRQK